MTATEQTALSEELEETLREALGKKLNKPMRYYLDTCERCGACNTACHMFVITQDPKHAPAHKMELLRRFYRRYFTRLGRSVPWLTRAKRFDKQTLDEMAEAVFECSGCRRCAAFCPLGLDPTWMISAGRHLASIGGIAPEDLELLADTQSMRKESLETHMGTYLRQIEGITKKLREETGNEAATISVASEEPVDFLYVPIAGVHTILPVAKIFETAGLKWALSKYDASNYAYFLGDGSRAQPLTKAIAEEAKTANAKTVVITECGHAYRILRHLAPLWFDGVPFQVKNIIEVLADLLQEQKIKIDISTNGERLTYHDPCNYGRNGGMFEAPRYVLGQVAQEFVELTSDPQTNWCCGGGGGLVAIDEDEVKELRMKVGKKKADQIRTTEAKIVVTGCENCKLQIADLSEHYDLNIKVRGVMDLVADALITKP
ncbi:MAG: (Fe-S)-binding protein [Candidatus Hodarchaeales archaeon]|jgi:Fe-S oxidoreductase